MSLKPLQDRVLVKRVEEITETASGIIIPDGQTEKPAQGKVINVGPGHRNADGTHTVLGVTEGDVVVFGKYAGTEVEVDGQEYLLMREDDILGVFDK